VARLEATRRLASALDARTDVSLLAAQGTVPSGDCPYNRYELSEALSVIAGWRVAGSLFASASGTVPWDCPYGRYELSVASRVISGTAARAFETGQFSFASLAACSKPASSRPSTSPRTVRWIAVMPNPPFTLSSVT